MIFVSQGHPRGIGLEVFIKSFVLLTRDQSKNFLLICEREVLKENLRLLNLPFKLSASYLKIGQNTLLCHFIKSKNSSLESLNYCLSKVKDKDVLLTLPSSKDLFNGHAGHTEYLRSYYNTGVSMFFKNGTTNLLLLSDHISLNRVSELLTSDFIFNKVKQTIGQLTKYKISTIKEVLFYGINPHGGENGILGNDKEVFSLSVKKLQEQFPGIEFIYPLSGDTMLTDRHNDYQLLVSPFHDQGLTAFKTMYKFNGMHFSLGLPFLRLSVDHGTAPNLFGKNIADYSGIYKLINFLIKKKYGLN